MNANKKTATRTWTLLAAVAGLLLAGKARAATNPAYLNIDVTVNAQVSVEVNNQASSSGTALTWNTNSANQVFTAGTNVTTTTVKNDSNVTEKWFLSGSTNSVNTSGVGTASWTLAGSSTSVGADAYALQAVFGSTNTAATGGCPLNGAADWNNVNSAPVL